METPQFINGFTSWMETYYQITTMIQNHLDISWNRDKIQTLVTTTHRQYGSMQLPHLAKELTDKFEQLYAGETWEEVEWFDTLEAFFEEENNKTN